MIGGEKWYYMILLVRKIKNANDLYIYKKNKGFGINKQIEINFEKNQKVLLIEDLAN